MARVLLLCDDQLDLQTRRLVLSLGRDLGSSFDISSRALAGGDLWFMHQLRLARSIREHRSDVTIAVGLASLAAATMANASPIVFCFKSFPKVSQVKWLRAAMEYRDIQLVCPTSTMHRFCVERGVPIDRCHLIRPGVEFGRVNRRRDPKLRTALGLADADYVWLLPGESTRGADHDMAVWAVAILNHLSPKHRVLTWGYGDRTRHLKYLAASQAQTKLFTSAQAALGRSIDFEELLPAADGVLISAGGSVATLPIAICMAAGLPIVSTVTSEVAELLEDRHTALMVPRRSPRTIAQRIMDLQADKNVQWAIADMAKTEAFEYFAHSRFVNQWRMVLNQVVAGETVTVPQAAPGAGLRFHGRG